MKLKVRVEMELAAALDLYLNFTGVIITVHWLSRDVQPADRNYTWGGGGVGGGGSEKFIRFC